MLQIFQYHTVLRSGAGSCENWSTCLQGDVREHIQSLSDCGVDALAVKTKSEIENISALVIPGGESTTIAKLARSFDLFDLIKDRIKGGMPTYGSCAGMILLSDVVEDAIIGQESFGGIDMVVKRKCFRPTS